MNENGGIMNIERKDTMPDLFNLTPEMKRYFATLPERAREEIMRGGAKINSLEDLKAAAKEWIDDEENA